MCCVALAERERLNMWPPLPLRTCDSFDEGIEDSQESPDPRPTYGLRTPHHSVENGQQASFGGFSGLVNSFSAQGLDSGLSGAPTALRRQSMASEIDSPAVRKHSDHIERRVPSCPQKEGSKVRCGIP